MEIFISHVEGETFDLLQEELKRITDDNIFINEKFMKCALQVKNHISSSNKLGYKDIVIQMMNWIEKNNPQLISDKNQTKFLKEELKIYIAKMNKDSIQGYCL